MNRFPSPQVSGNDTDKIGDGVVLSGDGGESDGFREWKAETASVSESTSFNLLSEAGIGSFVWQPESGVFALSGESAVGSIEDFLALVPEAERPYTDAFLTKDWRAIDGVERLETSWRNGQGEAVAIVIVARRDTNSRAPRIQGILLPAALAAPGKDGFSGNLDLDPCGDPADLQVFRRLLGAAAIALVEWDENGGHRLLGISSIEGGTSHDESFLDRLIAFHGPVPEDWNEGVFLEGGFGFPECFARLVPVDAGKPATAVLVGFGRTGEGRSKERLVRLAATTIGLAIRGRRDRTARREVEMLLERAQRLATVGQLAAGVAHDFNNLLTVIQGHVSFLELSLDPVEGRTKESIGQIENATREAVGLARQLLLFGKSGRDSFGEIDLNSAVEAIVKMLRRMIEESVEIQTELGEDAGRIFADSGMLGQVVMNLVVNARDAMPEGGRIRISTCREAGNSVLVIEDNGPGIPPEHIDRIFDPFFSTKEEGKGTGLGLANVASIVARHEGKIDVSSAPGKGARFEVCFPTVRDSATATEPNTAPEKPEATESGKSAQSRSTSPVDVDSIRGSRVLLVEDESGVRKLVKKLLEMHGCTVVEAASGKKALDLWPEVCDEISVVVTDVVMPEGVSGWDLAKELHRRSPEIGILLTSGYDERPEDHGLGDDPKIAFLQKPYEARNLKRNIRELLAQAV